MVVFYDWPTGKRIKYAHERTVNRTLVLWLNKGQIFYAA